MRRRYDDTNTNTRTEKKLCSICILGNKSITHFDSFSSSFLPPLPPSSHPPSNSLLSLLTHIEILLRADETLKHTHTKHTHTFVLSHSAASASSQQHTTHKTRKRRRRSHVRVIATQSTFAQTTTETRANQSFMSPCAFVRARKTCSMHHTNTHLSI